MAEPIAHNQFSLPKTMMGLQDKEERVEHVGGDPFSGPAGGIQRDTETLTQESRDLLGS
ncbi:MAG: hypothetical protein ABSA70_15835 [Terriglobia bacterium]